MAHRVNTIGSMIDAKKQGFENIEFDVLYDNNTKQIVMGHGGNALTGMTLSEFLTFEDNQFKRLWIDFKNLNEENFYDVYKLLEEMNDIFNLKSRVLFETSFKGNKLSKLSDSGWLTSYYLPTEKLIKYSEINDINKFTHDLVKQLKSQKVSSISFDNRVYDYVTNNLTPLKDNFIDKLELNTWLYLHTKEKNFERIYKAKPVVIDTKTKSIIVQHVTRFNV